MSARAPHSDILHELGVNTGKLNYHLKLLEGIIEKDDSRRYCLTDLGVRAFGMLRGLTEDYRARGTMGGSLLVIVLLSWWLI